MVAPVSPQVRYALFQLPAQACVALVGFLLWRFVGLPGWMAVAAVIAWAAKDAAMYPLLRRAYERPPHGAAAMIGRRGIVRRRIASRGTVTFGVELWNAEGAGAAAIESATEVRVVGVRGMTLMVEPIAPEGD
jgi:membrane protein implicated in regulation of membrane protease activity